MGSTEYYCDPRRYKSVPHRLYHNLGKGKFEDVTEKSGLSKFPGKGMGISIADFNDDGWPDIFIANDTEPNSLFINMKNGKFEERGLELGVGYDENARTGSSMGSDAKDFDNDGKSGYLLQQSSPASLAATARTTATLFNYAYSSKIQIDEHASLGME